MELMGIWEVISMEYADLMDTGNMRDAASDGIKAEMLAVQRALVLYCIGILNASGYDKRIVDMLKSNGIRLKFSESNEASFRRDLGRAVTLSKKILAKQRGYERKSKEAALLLAETTGGGVMDEERWAESLVYISKEAGYHIDKDRITVQEYAIHHRQMVKKMEAESRIAQRVKNH